jgi:hypothetical protein
VSDTEKWLARRMGEWLNREVEETILGAEPAVTELISASSAVTDQAFTAEYLLRLMGKLRAEQRWLYGRPVRAMKMGRVELEYIRRACQPASESLPGSMIPPGDSCWGIPCYEVGRHSYYEPIYEDEAPTLEALNERLMQEPRAIWGEVVTG